MSTGYSRYSAPEGHATESTTLYAPDDMADANISGAAPYNHLTPSNEYDDYPNETFGDTPVQPTPNVNGFTPYRGAEQHGVRFTGQEHTYEPGHYSGEQRAFENYVSPNITPRDLSPAEPIRVKVVQDANLLRGGPKARASNFTIPADGSWLIIAQEHRYRTRIVIQVQTALASAGAATAGEGNFALCPDSSNPSDIGSIILRCSEFGGNAITSGFNTFETSVTCGFAIRTMPLTIPGQFTVSVWQEYAAFDGEALL